MEIKKYQICTNCIRDTSDPIWPLARAPRLAPKDAAGKRLDEAELY